jgi:hypothetical protein
VTLPLPPRPTDRSTVWLFLVLALWMGVLTWMLVTAAAARSQARHAPEALLLARLTVHEAGLDSPADAVLIDEVLRGIVERDGVSYSRAVELASPRWSRCAVRRSCERTVSGPAGGRRRAGMCIARGGSSCSRGVSAWCAVRCRACARSRRGCGGAEPMCCAGRDAARRGVMLGVWARGIWGAHGSDEAGR